MKPCRVALIAVAKNRGLDAAATEAYHLRPNGRWQPWTRAFGPELRLGPQEAVVARLTGSK